MCQAQCFVALADLAGSLRLAHCFQQPSNPGTGRAAELAQQVIAVNQRRRSDLLLWSLPPGFEQAARDIELPLPQIHWKSQPIGRQGVSQGMQADIHARWTGIAEEAVDGAPRGFCLAMQQKEWAHVMRDNQGSVFDLGIAQVQLLEALAQQPFALLRVLVKGNLAARLHTAGERLANIMVERSQNQKREKIAQRVKCLAQVRLELLAKASQARPKTSKSTPTTTSRREG